MALDRNAIRDCYAQVRSIRRLMLQLADDLGDLSIVEARDKGRESVHAAETFIADAGPRTS
jgi:hypothetical protein